MMKRRVGLTVMAAILGEFAAGAASGAVIEAVAAVPRLAAISAAPSALAGMPISGASSLALPALSLSVPFAYSAAVALPAASVAAALPEVAAAAAPALVPSAAAFAPSRGESVPGALVRAAGQPTAFAQAAAADGPSFDGASELKAAAPALPAEHAALVAKAADSFRQKGIPVVKIRYSAGYEMQGMGMYDPPTWTDASFNVSFADVETYRRWETTLPKKISGLRVYADQAGELDNIRRWESEAALVGKAADYFRQKGIPVATLRYHPVIQDWSGDSFSVSFADVETYRRWKGALPKKIDGLPVSVESGQANELDKILATEEKAALTGRIAAYFAKKGFAVGHIGYSEGSESQGMGMYDPPTWQEGHVTVVFEDAAGYERWQKRFFKRVEGYRMVAVLKGAQP